MTDFDLLLKAKSIVSAMADIYDPACLDEDAFVAKQAAMNSLTSQRSSLISAARHNKISWEQYHTFEERYKDVCVFWEQLENAYRYNNTKFARKKGIYYYIVTHDGLIEKKPFILVDNILIIFREYIERYHRISRHHHLNKSTYQQIENAYGYFHDAYEILSAPQYREIYSAIPDEVYDALLKNLYYWELIYRQSNTWLNGYMSTHPDGGRGYLDILWKSNPLLIPESYQDLIFKAKINMRHKPWSLSAEKRLVREYVSGKDIDLLAIAYGRDPSVIVRKLREHRVIRFDRERKNFVPVAPTEC